MMWYYLYQLENLLTAAVADNIRELPSPDNLKNKIIVKAKKPKGWF